MTNRRACMLTITATVLLHAQGLPITNDRLLHADKEPGNWLMYSSTYNSWRFSGLDQINQGNVKNLHVKWLFQGRHNEKFETTPLVVDGIMYLTRPENDIYALDAETGRVLWVYSYRNPERTYNCCGRVNRGLGDSGQDPVHEHARYAPGRGRCQIGPRTLEDRHSRLRRRRWLCRHRRAADREGQGDRRHGGRRASSLRFPRRL